MKVQQTATIEGDALVLRVIEHPSGVVLGKKVYGGLGKYAVLNPVQGYIELRLPKRSGLDIKPGGKTQ